MREDPIWAQDAGIWRAATLLALCAATAVLFVTAARAPSFSTTPSAAANPTFEAFDGLGFPTSAPAQKDKVRLVVIGGFPERSRNVLKVKVPGIRGGRCTFSLSVSDYYTWACDQPGDGSKGGDILSKGLAAARPLLREHGLCAGTFPGGWAAGPMLVHRCGESLTTEIEKTLKRSKHG